MKIFFLALILGIFVGSIATNYFSDPNAYQKLKDAKTRLLEPAQANANEESTAEPEPPAMFEVGGGEFQPNQPPNKTVEPTPPDVVEETEVPTVEAEPEPETTTTQNPAPKSRADELIEQGSKKAEEIADTVTEKAKEVAEEAKPYLETGVDLTIATAIRAQFKLERRIDSNAISISVKDRAVTLGGEVPSAEIKQLAIEIAVFTKGVTGVEEHLTISP
ncbi:Putative phospholipid-binding domain family [Verrucomicrobiia bacterium DG1235]|nr:Putative phospholipid-binding domain family [Verrucomicrobiae bacterium DG1235]